MTPAVQVVLPGGASPSGGNVYDRMVCHGMAAAGIAVREVAVPGTWPCPDAEARDGLARALADLPDSATVLIDGLVACGVPDVVVPAAKRLDLTVLVHLPLADETGLAPQLARHLDARERETLHAAGTVVATSEWAARRLVDHHGLRPHRVHAVPPSVTPAPPAAGTGSGSRLVCVAAVIPRKGQDLLAEALASVTDLTWTCDCVGAVRGDTGYVEGLRRHGLGDRFRLVGPRTGTALAATYADADLLVLPSRAETYGMVVTEALARAVPVLATTVGGLPDTLGQAPDGSLPGLLVPPDDVALGAALRHWLTDAELRERLRESARLRRETLSGWDTTATELAGVLLRHREAA